MCADREDPQKLWQDCTDPAPHVSESCSVERIESPRFLVSPEHVGRIIDGEITRERRGRIVNSYAELEGRMADQLSFLVSNIYTDRLIRRLDEEGIERSIRDKKIDGVDSIIYVPAEDSETYRYFLEVAARRKDLGLSVRPLQANLSSSELHALNESPGILALGIETRGGVGQARPYLVPGGRFNEMYGWDSYFMSLGLIADKRPELAISMVDNLAYQIRHYGMVLNANRSYYLSRSQPPVFASMASAALKAADEAQLWRNDSERENWVRGIVDAAVSEYFNKWSRPEQLDPATGLARYHDTGWGFCPEVEPGHYDVIVNRYAESLGMTCSQFISSWNAGSIDRTEHPELVKLIKNDRAMRESGHDTSYRFLNRASDLAPVELNALLFGAETAIAQLIDEAGGAIEVAGRSYTSDDFKDLASERRERIDRYLWDPAVSLYLDWDSALNARSSYVSAASLFALFTGAAKQERAAEFVSSILARIECSGGLAGSSEDSRGPISEARPLRQWDFPFGWAPHHIAACAGLEQYGFSGDAERIAFKWCHMVLKEALSRGGAVVERYDVANSTVFEGVEYGVQGLLGCIDGGAGFGWTNASFNLLRRHLSSEAESRLNRLAEPK